MSFFQGTGIFSNGESCFGRDLTIDCFACPGFEKAFSRVFEFICLWKLTIISGKGASEILGWDSALLILSISTELKKLRLRNRLLQKVR